VALREKIEHDLQQAVSNQPDMNAYLNGEKNLAEISNIQSAINILSADFGALRKSLLDVADAVDVAQGN
jgi:hypothetical protein